MTWRQLITSSFRLIHRTAAGRTVAESHMDDALLVLNGMLDEFNTHSLVIYETGRDVYSWGASVSSRTIGPGGDFDAARPVRIDYAGLIVDDRERPIDVWGVDKWRRADKTRTGTPEAVYSDDGNPRSTLHLLPIPAADVELVLYIPRALTEIADLSETVTLPPGYPDAIRYNLAVHLGEEWNLPVSARTERKAEEKLGRIKARNMPILEMAVDPALTGRGYFNIETGSWER